VSESPNQSPMPSRSQRQSENGRATRSGSEYGSGLVTLGGGDETQSAVSVLVLSVSIVGGATVLALVVFGCVILPRFVRWNMRSGCDQIQAPLDLEEGSNSAVEEIDLSLSGSRNPLLPPVPI
jgi:hypothetical protein